MLYPHEYLLFGAAAHCFKAECRLRKPDQAGLKTETYWNNRATPLPLGLHFLLRREEGEEAAQLCIQQPNQPDICLAYNGEEVGEWALQQGGRFGLPLCQPANTNGLFPDTQIHAYEECYQQDDVTLHFRQGITYFAFNQDEERAFIGTEPQAIHLTIHTTAPHLNGKLRRALANAAALPTISPALHAQQLARRQTWWWEGTCPTNRPVAEQIPQLANIELEGKLSVPGDFSTTCWRLRDAMQQGALAGFTSYQNPLWARHSHNVVRYLKSKQKLTLQGAAYRFSEKKLGAMQEDVMRSERGDVKIRQEVKPIYSLIVSFAKAQAVQAEAKKRTPLGDLSCHKCKFLVQSEVTGGGYHVLIDHSLAAAHPGQVLTQIEVECQWKKLPPRDTLSNPVCTAVAEIEQLTQAIRTLLPDVQPTQLGKRRWLKSLFEESQP